MAGERGSPVPESFEAQVVEALRRLYEPTALARCALGDVVLRSDRGPGRSRALRELLVEAIEAMNPGPGVPFRSVACRSYNAIRMRYVEGLTTEAIAKELAVSERQAYRDVARAERELAAWLRSRRPPAGPVAEPSGADASEEFERLQLSPSDVSLMTAAEAAGRAVSSLAGRTGTSVELEASLAVKVLADSAALQQCLTAALSYGIQAGARCICVGASSDGDVVDAWLRWRRPDGGTAAPKALLGTARGLAKALGADLRLDESEANVELSLRLRACRLDTVLVIDDSAGLRELMERYLAGSDWRAVGVADPDEGLRLADELVPQAIVLDILMPGADGWAVLTQLKSDARTAAIPVVVCSVFNDPELAFSLGAVAFVAKPVTRAKLLQALRPLRR